MVEWLERHGYDAECRRKVVSSRLGFAMRRLENSLCHSSSKQVPFSNWGMLRQRKESYRLRLSSAVPEIRPLPLPFLFLAMANLYPFLPHYAASDLGLH